MTHGYKHYKSDGKGTSVNIICCGCKRVFRGRTAAGVEATVRRHMRISHDAVPSTQSPEKINLFPDVGKRTSTLRCGGDEERLITQMVAELGELD
jgi:hypothetical protein